jgi:hypothetical protein
MSGDCSVLVSSCDAYSDLWTPYFTLLARFWPDCPYPVYLGANQGVFEHPALHSILHSPAKLNWSSNMLDYLSSLETEYVLLTLEDFFLQKPVATAKITEALFFLAQNEGHCLRLIGRPAPRRMLANEPEYGIIEPGEPYRVSTQAALWRRSSLQAILHAGETIWAFELNGSQKSERLFPRGFYGMRNSPFPYFHHVIERGKWFPWEKLKYAQLDIGCDFSRRPTMNFAEASRWILKKSAAMALQSLGLR